MRAAREARGVGVSLSTANTWEKERKIKYAEKGYNPALLEADDKLPGPKRYGQLNAHAKRAHDDFAYFQSYYLGRISQPWQVEAAEKLVTLLESPRKEYAVVNVAPGSGKTVLFAHDIPAWLTLRNRAIRGLIGSATQSLANRNVHRLRQYPRTPGARLARRGAAAQRVRGRAQGSNGQGLRPLQAARTRPVDPRRLRRHAVRRHERHREGTDLVRLRHGHRLHRRALRLRDLGRPGRPAQTPLRGAEGSAGDDVDRHRRVTTRARRPAGPPGPEAERPTTSTATPWT